MTVNFLQVELKKNLDGSVSGMLPNGLVCTWDRDSSNRPTMRNKWVTLNCFKWKALWVENFSQNTV